MRRREFCESALATAFAATIPGTYLLAGENRSGNRTAPSVQAIRVTGEEAVLEANAVADFRDSLRGAIASQWR